MKKDNPLKSVKGKIITGLSLTMIVAVASAFTLPAMAANSNSSDTAGETTMVQITEAQAIATVEAANPNATVICEELDTEDGTAVYDLIVTAADGSKTEVNVDANTGAILSSTDEDTDIEENDENEADDSDNDVEENDAEENDAEEASEDAALASQVKISEDQAIAIVEAANPGATVTCDELGNENGTAVYEFDVKAADGTKSEVKVDANTGTILSASDTEAENED